VYDDDGTTYEYEQGIFSTDTIAHDRNAARALISIGTRFGSYVVPQRDWRAEFKWVSGAPDSVLLDGKAVTEISLDSLYAAGGAGWVFDAAAKNCLVKFPDNGEAHSLAVYFNQDAASAETGNLLPFQFHLHQNFPNPFNPATTIGFTVPFTGQTLLKVFNVLGQEVRTLFDGIAEAGIDYHAQFNAGILSSGVYIARLSSGDKVQLKKMLLMK
jgi:hypothetical protein